MDHMPTDSSGSQGWDCSRIPVEETREPKSGHSIEAFQSVISPAHTHIRGGRRGPVMQALGGYLSGTEEKPLLSSLPFSHAGQEPYIFLAVKALCVSWQHKFLEHSPFLSQRAEVRACGPCWQLGACSSPMRGGGLLPTRRDFCFFLVHLR